MPALDPKCRARGFIAKNRHPQWSRDPSAGWRRSSCRLCLSLSLHGWHRFRVLEWPLLRRPLGLSLALVAVLAMGDLGVIALFGSTQSSTLALMIYQQLGAYLVPQATVTALLLLLLCLGMFALLERLIGGRADAAR